MTNKLHQVILLCMCICATLVFSFPDVSRQNDIDDAEVIESSDPGGGITAPDGPGPSVLGSLDKIFKSVKDFDQYQCIERMMCEYMQGNGDVAGIGNLLGGAGGGGAGGIPGLSALAGIPGLSGLLGGGGGGQTGLGGQGGLASGLASLVGGGSQQTVRGQFPNQQFPQQQFQQQQFLQQQFPQQQFAPQQFGGFAPQQGFAGPSGFSRPARRVQQETFQPQPPASGGGFLETIENFFFGSKKRSGRKKRQTNLQGNLIRLMQATKLDNLSAFPYVRAALIGYGSKSQNSGITRAGGGACSQLYRQCPTEPKQLLNYINNHNGGLVNQVQPSVDNEVAPILSAIVSDFAGGSGSSSASSVISTKLGSTTTASPTFAAADTFITNAIVQGASGPFSNALSSLANLITGNKSKK